MVFLHLNPAAGTIPATVITTTVDDSGVANFSLTYLKSSAVSIVDRIRASTLVGGTETSSSLTFRLPYERTEGDLRQSGHLFYANHLKGGRGVCGDMQAGAFLHGYCKRLFHQFTQFGDHIAGRRLYLQRSGRNTFRYEID